MKRGGGGGLRERVNEYVGEVMRCTRHVLFRAEGGQCSDTLL